MKKQEYLTILEDAISDIGIFQWWGEKFPKTFQLEFSYSQIYNPPVEKSKAPSQLIALRFINPIKIISLKFSKSLDDNWLEKLRKEKINGFQIYPGEFIFNDKDFVKSLLKESIKSETYYETSVKKLNFPKSNFPKSNLTLAFKAGYAGLIVFADDMKIINMQGEIKKKDIKKANNNWWRYWNKYWKLKDTKNPLPYDWACEATIPGKKE